MGVVGLALTSSGSTEVRSRANGLFDDIRRVGWTALGASIAYAIFSAASRSGCLGGFGVEGAPIDEMGNAGSSTPMCVDMQLQPSPLIWLVIAVTFLVGFDAASKAEDIRSAQRPLKLATRLIVVIPIIAIVGATVWMFTVPLDVFLSTGGYVAPPGVSVDVYPLTTP